MRPNLILWTCLVLLVMFAGVCQAEETPDISVKAEVNKATLTIGDLVEYTVTIRHKPDVQILSRIPPPAPDILEIRKVEEIKTADGEIQIQGRKFTLTAYELGEFILDPVQIQYRKGSGNPETIETSKIFLAVKSVTGEEPKTDIRGIKSVVSIPLKILRYILIFLLVALLAASPFIYRYFKQRQAQPVQPERLLTPEEEALSALQRLFESDLLRKGKFREYFFSMSEIVRIYLEKRYRILAVESTTYEIARDLKNLEIPAPVRQKIADLLENADLAKFAKWKPEPGEVLTLNKRAKEIVLDSTPAEKEPEKNGV